MPIEAAGGALTMDKMDNPALDSGQSKVQNRVADVRPDTRTLGHDELDGVAGALQWTIKPCFIPSYSIS
jgi:hypothetical protein